ncbi:hypothetical protein H4W23_23285 [Streptomyces gardneri]|uniref:hypothetical protein n=1 Tax=Streptomyces gardneri TaxID=66892 RepID=UPI0006E343BB|nr:hypothetical protein [Streptomyces gardneri]QPK47258.1 hypothetical protein H4W23_23285 [Streptomyces gardneri]WRK38681.1 hypothetical protein U0M97_23385 [Streptomyces venezuelae]
MTQNGQGPEPQYPAAPPAHDGARGGAQPWDGAWGPAAGQPGGQPLPPAQPLPPEAPPGAADMQSTQYLPPVPQQHFPPQAPPIPPQPGYGYPPPAAQAAADMQATQHIAPVPGAMPPVQAQQPGYGYPPPAAQAAADMQATQHMAAIPPHPGAGSDTQFLGTGPLPGQPAGAADATQYIAPVPPQAQAQQPGERQPPAEFDNLFRTEAPRAPQQPQAYQPPLGAPPGPQGPGGQQPAPPAYQQHQQQHQGPPQHGYQAQQPPQYAYQDAYYDDEPEPPRRKSPVALIAAVVAGCAVVGLGAGMLLSGEDEKDPKTPGQNVAASSAAPPSATTAAPPAEKPADPAEPQAKELDKLLATSNSSRDTVISSVALINQCKDLDKAARDLRGAADQRRGLVTKLRTLSVDKLPDNPALTGALTRAWQASAAADDHYAAWAVQMKAKKACKDGKAKRTNRLAEAEKKSGEATAAKKQAAGLWNPTAVKYGLDKRTPTQL